MNIARWWLNKFDIMWQHPKLCNNSNNIYLTIDDAIYSESFEEILTILNKFGTKATFFVISSSVTDKNRHLLIDALKMGHQLANHGDKNIPHMLQSFNVLEKEIIKCEKLLGNLYNEANVQYPTIKYFRPGCGYVTQTIIDVCSKLNYKVVLGSVYPSDPHWPLPNFYAWFIMTKVQNNDIVIIHDRWWTSSTLLKMLPRLSKQYNINALQV